MQKFKNENSHAQDHIKNQMNAIRFFDDLSLKRKRNKRETHILLHI